MSMSLNMAAMLQAPSRCGLVSEEMEEPAHHAERHDDRYIRYRDEILDVYVRPYAGAISSSLWTTTLGLVVPGWLRSTSNRIPSSVWTGHHAHLISTRSSIFGT